jgi:DNA-binding IclR family transcriptional regulator
MPRDRSNSGKEALVLQFRADGMSMGVIARRLRMPKSSVQRILDTEVKCVMSSWRSAPGQGQAGLGEAAVDEAGPVLDAAQAPANGRD